MIAALWLAACAGDDGVGTEAGSGGAESSEGASSSSSAPSSSSGPTSSGDGTSSTGEDVDEATLLVTEFTIPAGATVVEFEFEADGEAPPFSTVGAPVRVAVVDRSHPARDQSQLCMGNHPLNGCATVDYGAFGITHDNRLTVAGDGAPVELHLHKDRSVQPLAEPLPPDE